MSPTAPMTPTAIPALAPTERPSLELDEDVEAPEVEFAPATAVLPDVLGFEPVVGLVRVWVCRMVWDPEVSTPTTVSVGAVEVSGEPSASWVKAAGKEFVGVAAPSPSVIVVYPPMMPVKVGSAVT